MEATETNSNASDFDFEREGVQMVGDDKRSTSEAISDGKEENEPKTLASIMPDFMKMFDEAIAKRKSEGGISEPEPTTWQGWAERYATHPAIQRLDHSLEFFPQLLAKMKYDCLNGNRGWIMFGRPGCGKTYRASIISNTIGIRMMSAQSMVLKFCSSKPNSEEFIRNLAGLGTVTIAGRSPARDLIIDDLGTELPKATLFGTPCQPMLEMLSMRCDEWPRVRTYITTNLTPEELKLHVGDRLWSRFNEQMVFLHFKEIDHRVNNTEPLPSPASVNYRCNLTDIAKVFTEDEGQVQQENTNS